MTVAFLIMILIAFVVLSYRRTIWGLSIIVLMLPSYLYRFNILGLPSTLLELMILLLFGIWLIKGWPHKYKDLRKLSTTLKSLLGLWLVVSLMALAVNPTLAALGLWRAYFLEPLFFFIVFINSVRDKKDFMMIVRALGILVIWLFVVAIYQNYSHWNYLPAYNFPQVKRLTAVFSYPNALSLLTAPLAAFFAGWWVKSRHKLADWPYLLVFVLALALAALARSDGAVVAILTSLVLLLILDKKNRKWRLSLAAVVIIILFIFSSLPARLADFKQQLFSPRLDLAATSLEIRSSQWQETWQMLKDHSFWGAGLNGYQPAMAPYHQTDWLEVYLYPHNIFLNFWTELGLAGVIIFLAWLIYIGMLLRKLFRQKNRLAWPFTLLWFTWLVHGLVDVPYFKNDLSLLFFIILGLTILAGDKKYDLHNS